MGVNKFSSVEIILGSALCLLVELANLFLDLIGIGFVIMPVIKAMIWFMLTIWFMAKGDKFIYKPARAITSYVSQALPLVPTLLMSFLINVYMHNHPKAAALTGKAVGTAVGGPAGGAAGEVVMGGSVKEAAKGFVSPMGKAQGVDSAISSAPQKVPLQKREYKI